jgi:hypothetical protein
MSRADVASKVLHLLGLPFRLLWNALTSIANLTRPQIRSLVTVAFLAGMISLSGENWAITFAADHASHRFAEDGEGAAALLGFLTERMRYISGLQAWLALILGAVILNADYVRLKLGDNEASLGSKGTGE